MVTELYSSDLRAVALDGQPLDTSGTMALQITSTSDCDEQTESIARIMEGIVDSFSPRGCEQRGLESYLIADVSVRVLYAGETSLPTLFGIAVEEYRGNLYMRVLLNQEKFRSLNRRATDRFFQEIELDNSIVQLNLINDGSRPIRVFVDEAFVQGAPVLSRSFDLDRRGRIEIRLSNVGVAHLGDSGWAYGFRILRPEAGRLN